VEGGVEKGKAILNRMNQTEIFDRSAADDAEGKPLHFSVSILRGGIKRSNMTQSKTLARKSPQDVSQLALLEQQRRMSGGNYSVMWHPCARGRIFDR
jgi:hypothetical protein